MNRETGDNKGTGFVKFKDSKIAQQLIDKSNEFNQVYLDKKNNNSEADNMFSGKQFNHNKHDKLNNRYKWNGFRNERKTINFSGSQEKRRSE